ncbi:MAG: tRNA (adenosine(37)-N6)-threonylcarbamoyltransferase complex ATPase subunit type 1 TsaE [Thermodesulfovibrionales bacterium]|nr:tRNA (adenosine(37)-N6)-threonylcarbamoyltransferase complex ATPase subunit type 1 TsaE [Thermodesulfovibrionales bacterium]
MKPIKVITKSERDTIKVGTKIGNIIKSHKLPIIILLYGDIGTGKTTLIKGIGLSLGIDERDIASASFIIISVYESKPPLCHIDLYRLDEGTDIDNIGIWDYLSDDNISVIEWADRLGKGQPDGAIKITMKEMDETIREIIIEGLDEKDWDF